MFAHHPGHHLSLLDLTGDLYEQFGVRLAKQSLQDRFNFKAVSFMRLVLSKMLKQQVCCDLEKGALANFNRVRIKDSTRFALPENYAGTYRGYGGATPHSESMISIQYEYDLLSGETMDLRLTSGLCNDQRDSKEYTQNIVANDLFIRDLGYCTIAYLNKIIDQKAYFLNRLAPQTTVYHANQPNHEIDLKACLKKIKRHQLPYLAYEVLVGKRAKLPSRLIISAVDDSTYEKRLRKTRKQANSYGYNVSDSFKVRAQLNLFITNAPVEWVPAEKVKAIYGLRWQIELIFKIWKSQARINDLKEVKIHRFECQLLGKIIWLLLNWKIYHWIDHWVKKNLPKQCCSIWKYYKCAFRISYLLREALNSFQKAGQLIELLINMAKYQFLLERKKGKCSYYHHFMSLN